MTEQLTSKYGAKWSTSNPILIEQGAIRLGGTWKNKKGEECGLGLYQHFKNLQSLYWPNKVWHRWNELLLREFVEKSTVAVLGPANSGKTREASDFALTFYSVFPKETTVLMSSTDIRSLSLRIWGEAKKNWLIARESFPDFPGYITDSRQMITTDGRDIEGRDYRCGVICIPCQVGGQYVGLGKYVGIKNKYVILVADELQFMGKSFVEAIANLNKNQGFRCIGLGNPKDRTDALGILAEPHQDDGGWEGVDTTEVTKTWRTRFPNGICVQLVGTDSPNFDDPPDQYPFLINKKAIDADIALWGRDSLQFTMMNLGMMPPDSTSRRVITRTLCEQFHALEQPIWDSSTITKIGCLDAAYGSTGGDRCVFMELLMGKLVDGTPAIAVKGKPVIVPVKGIKTMTPEDQIAEHVKNECFSRGIQPENLFYDSTGRGTLGTAFARIWSPLVNPVEFGGRASDRPVSKGSKITCREFYSKFVSEMWYAVRHLIEAGQLRGLPEEVMNEGCLREWTVVAGNRIEVEPKDKTKKRMGRSPDLFDCLVTGVEGARRRGFVIDRQEKTRQQDNNWIKELKDRSKELRKKNHLKVAA